MKETYSLEEVKQMIKDVITIAFDPEPDAEFYEKLFSKYEEKMQEYITSLLLAALMARKLADITRGE